LQKLAMPVKHVGSTFAATLRQAASLAVAKVI
jgi:hypothetical protein